jgi:formate dehydrogenase subunit gamma
MSAATPRSAADPAVIRARRVEDVVVGDEIVRHRLTSRVIHWSVALSFFLALLTGLPLWTPVFGWLAPLVGGLHVCRWLHPWAGLLFAAAAMVMFVHWWGDMRLEAGDREWLRLRRIAAYMRHEDTGSEAGKYNGGQKLFFFAVGLGVIGLLVSGFVLWFPLALGRAVGEAAILLHDLTFILYVVAVILHVYLGTAAEPGTFHSMIRGTVTRPWARLHHPKWYREISGEQRPPS